MGCFVSHTPLLRVWPFGGQLNWPPLDSLVYTIPAARYINITSDRTCVKARWTHYPSLKRLSCERERSLIALKLHSSLIALKCAHCVTIFILKTITDPLEKQYYLRRWGFIQSSVYGNLYRTNFIQKWKRWHYLPFCHSQWLTLFFITQTKTLKNVLLFFFCYIVTASKRLLFKNLNNLMSLVPHILYKSIYFNYFI